MDQLKVCSRCKKSKPLGEFSKNVTRKDGLQAECRVCVKVFSKDYYEKNRDKRLEYQKDYAEKNRDKILEQKKDYNKSWRAANKDYHNDYNKDYNKTKYHSDPGFKATMLIRSQIHKLFKSSGQKKDKRSTELLGVTWEEAYSSLLKTIPEGYTEQDWLEGKLHIDHKIPISWYKELYGTLTEELIKKANHISNLQLLPAKDNLTKRNTYGHGMNNEIINYEDWVLMEQSTTISH